MVVIAYVNIHAHPDIHGQLGQGSTFSWPDTSHAHWPVVLERPGQGTQGWRGHSGARLGRQVGQTSLVRAATADFAQG